METTKRVLRSTKSPHIKPQVLSDDDESQVDDDDDEDYTGDDDMEMSFRGSDSKPKRDEVLLQKTRDIQVSHQTMNLKVCRACLCPRPPLLPLPPHCPLLPPAPAPRPAVLCVTCAREMRGAARFVERARRAEDAMKRIADKGMLTMENIQEIDREKNQLTGIPTFTVKHFPPDVYNCEFVYDENELTLKEKDTKVSDDIKIEDDLSLREGCLESDTAEDPFDTVNETVVNDTGNIEVKPNIIVAKKSLRKCKTEKCKEKPVKKVRKKATKDTKQEKTKQAQQKTLNKQKQTELQNKMDEYFNVTVFKTIEEKVAELQRRKDNASYINAPLKCEMCYQGYLDNETYDLHMHKHTEQCGAFTCAVCQYRCPSKERLRQHMYFRHSRKFSCKLCRFESHDKYRATLHMRFHEGKTYKCKHCEKVFNHIVNLHNHLRAKHPSDNVCPLCGYSFIGERGLATHRALTHGHDHRPIPAGGPSCEECGVKFATDAALQMHLNVSSRHGKTVENFKKRNYHQLHRSMRASERPAKDRARQTIARRNGVRVEKREIRLTKFDEPVPCEKCGALISSASEYHYHFKREHSNEKRTWYPADTHPHLCELCGKMLRNNALKDHMAEHEDGVTFKCDTCGKRFARKFNMRLHSRIHLGERYPCSVCGKLFNHMGNRDRHVRYVHTESKDFKCEFCGKCFKNDGARKLHTNHVHLRKPYPKRNRQRDTHTQMEEATQRKEAAGQPSTELRSDLPVWE